MIKKTTLVLVALIISIGASIAQSNDGQKPNYGATPEDSVKCVQCLSLYSEFYKQDNYKDAMKGWRGALETCPASSKNLYIRGDKMIKKFIADAGDNEEKKQAYIDTLLTIYDMRLANYGDSGYVIGKKGADIMKFRKNDYETAYNLMSQAQKISGTSLDAGVIVYYYVSAYYMYSKKKIEKDVIINLFLQLSDIIDYNVANREDDRIKNAYKVALSNIEKYFVKIADCESIINVYTPKYEAGKEDIDLLKNILATLDKRSCAEEQFYLDVAVSLYAKEPSTDAAYSIALSYLKKENLTESIKYFTMVVDSTQDDEQKVNALMYMAKASVKTKKFQSVRNYCNQAIAINPNLGEAYILIGDVYGYSSGSLGDNACTKKAGYWAAYDKYAKAKSVDSSVADEAAKKMANAKKQFPPKTDCFFQSINNGDSFTVGGWVNETTTVRVNE